MKQSGLTRRVNRRDRRLRERVHDPYRTRLKPPEPTVCGQCGAVFRKGRWQWAARPAAAQEALCPACHRTSDNVPAGIVTLGGAFLNRHRAEILALLHHEAEREKADHPLHRIMDIEETRERVVVRTTDIHLPRRLGDAVHRAYQGNLEFHYEEESYFLRVAWRRDD